MSRFRLLPVVTLVVASVALGLAPPAGAQFFIYPGRVGFSKNKVQYRNFEWKIYHSPHFDVYYYSDEAKLLEKVVSFAESAYDQLSREFDFQIKEPTPLIFYASHSAFEQNNVTLNFIPEGVGAFASPARFRMVMPVDMPDPKLMELMLHELTHIFQYHILFQGSLAKSLTSRPPTWFMEGMASYMAKDESTRDKMFLRDAVVNDRIPRVTQWDGGGYFAYRIGHAVFDFIEDRWGKDGFQDFIYEFRNTIGGGVGKAVKRTFRLDPEEFDQDFRRWLRKKYLPQLLETGEPADFGRRFRTQSNRQSQEISPVASPSGDLVAAFSSLKGDVDIVLFDTEHRQLLRNLTAGFSSKYQYLVSQELTIGRGMGRDLAFSPDGNTIAAFAKRESGRSLMLVDVLKGGIRKMYDLPGVDQALAPAWSPDGKSIAFSATNGNQFDIYIFHIESKKLEHLTNDEIYDGSPVFSPDGRSVVFSSVVGDGFAKLFRVDLEAPEERYQLTKGKSNEIDAVFSPDGKRLYFTSDRTGIENIYGLDLAKGEMRQYTNAVTGCFMPTVLEGPDEERLVFGSYWKGVFDLYVSDTEEPVGEPISETVNVTPTEPENLPRFEPDIQVSINPENREDHKGFKLFLENATSFIGIDNNQTLLGRVILSFSDYLGDRRLIGDFSAVESFSNFRVTYADLSHRVQWQVNLFDDRDFLIAFDPRRQEIRRSRTLFRETGAIASLVYPLSFYHRVEIGGGYMVRKLDAQAFITDPETGVDIPVIQPIDDNFPVIQGALVGDSAVFAPWGPISGRRWRLDAFWAPSTSGGTVTRNETLDVRQYIPLTRRSNLALRGFVGMSDGDDPSPIIFGGLDTLRGFDFRSLFGTRAFFTNFEVRFPLIDILATPFLGFQGIRGRIFLDMGGVWFDKFQHFQFYDSNTNRLKDGLAAYGWGITARFLGLELNWDFAKQWDFKDSIGGFRTSFWIGSRF